MSDDRHPPPDGEVGFYWIVAEAAEPWEVARWDGETWYLCGSDVPLHLVRPDGPHGVGPLLEPPPFSWHSTAPDGETE